VLLATGNEHMQMMSNFNGVISYALNATSGHLADALFSYISCKVKVKGKVFPYSLPSVGPGADPGVQAVSPQVT